MTEEMRAQCLPPQLQSLPHSRQSGPKVFSGDGLGG